jgi:hypothetical protein
VTNGLAYYKKRVVASDFKRLFEFISIDLWHCSHKFKLMMNLMAVKETGTTDFLITLPPGCIG